MAFKAKDLHYEKQEPAFLRKLRGEYGGDRHNVSIARPSKPRLETADEDGPTIVDETGESVTKEQYEAMAREDESGKGPDSAKPPIEGEKVEAQAGDSLHQEREEVRPEKLAAIGGSSKRKQGKVVGHEGERQIEDTVEDEVNKSHNSTKPSQKSKPKKKKIKLSFDEEGT